MDRMMKSLIAWLILFVVLSACAPTADFDVRGEWEYTMTSADGNLYDSGKIVFRGESTEGTYLQTNIYQVEYEGGFTASGTTLTLTGPETWQGTLADADHMSGTWSRDDGTNGTFAARRK